jgi:PAS domain S-box-containing protein
MKTHKTAKEYISTNEEKCRILFDSNRDSITLFRLDLYGNLGNFIEANSATNKLFGYTKKELLEMNICDLEHTTDPKIKSKISCLPPQGSISFETIIKNKKGHLRNVEIETVCVNYMCEPALMNITRDITERKQIEENTRKAQENLTTILEAIPDLLFEVDLEGKIYYYQGSRNDLLAVPETEFLGKKFQDFLPVDAANVCFEAIQEALNKGWSIGKQYSLNLAKGKSWFELSVSPIKETGNKIQHFIILARDITARQNAEETLRESEEKYRGLVENSPDGIVIYIEDKIAFINVEGIRMLGAKNKEEIIGNPLLQYVHPDSLENIVKKIKEVSRDKNASEIVEEKFLTIQGIPFYAEIKAIPTFYEHKPAVQVIVHDITQRKKSALELNKIHRVYALISQINNLILRTHNQEQLFQEICNIAVNFGKFRMSWIGLLNNHHKIATEAYAGYENGYFKESNMTTILDVPEGRGPTGKALREGRTVICNDIATDPMMKPWRKDAIKRGYSSVISIPIIVRNKKIGNFNLYSEETNFFSSEEEISLLEKIVLNIAFALEAIQIEEDRKHTEEKIRQLSQAVEQSPVTIIITNTNGEIEYANPKFVETTGYTIEEVVGKNPRFLKSDYTSSNEYGELWQTLKIGKEWHGEFHNKRKDGSFFWESATISPIINAQGESTHFIAIKEDITERKIAEQELINAKLRAEESDRLKLAFLANMSHEIRTPMNGILGFTELLKAPQLTGKKQQEYINIIEKSGKRMLNIINDIISISKVESGQIEVKLSETDVNEQINYIHNFFKLEAKQKGIHLKINKELPKKNKFIKTDSEKLYAILTNLIKNAIKFTNEGYIEFGCEKKEGNLEFYVKDSGIGISDEQKKIVFERFRQANDSISRSHEGSGLGLAISKAYVEILGGKIWVESEEGKGSAFYFTLPYQLEFEHKEKKVVQQTNSDVKEENKINNLKVLIVEDDDISKLLITIAVKPFSKEILKVSNGIEAIEACRNNPDIDLVMMDINMPEMGGYEATKQIREFNKDLVIIAQTANGMQSDRDEAIASGCTDYISKPINIIKLSKLIHNYFNK